jgi:hypothetical protein
MKKTSISKIKQTTGFTDATTKKMEYMNSLRNKNLDSIVDRHEFITTTVSHLEHHLRKIIDIEIQENEEYYKNIWRLLVIPAHQQFPTESSSLENMIISYLTFNSTKPILKQLENFSFIKDFFKWFNSKEDDYNNILEIYEPEQRNDVQHPGNIPDCSERLRKIQKNIDGFFNMLIITYRASLSHGRTIKTYDSQTPDTEIQEIIKKQDDRIKKLPKIIQNTRSRWILKQEFTEHLNNLKSLFGARTQ